MTFAEVLLLVAGVTGIYYRLRPLQRALERYLARTFSARGSRFPRKTMDVLARRGTLLQGAM
jgi:hypothetical protein